MALSSDGAKMFVIGNAGDDVNEYALSAAFDASTAEFVDAFSVSSQETAPRDMAFSNDGTKMFVIGNDGDEINEYMLSTAFDASTAVFADAFSASPEETSPQGMAFSSDGAKMFVIGSVGDDVNEYALSSVYPITVTGQANAAPVLGAIGAKSVDELAELAFTATATDGDNDPLEFSLVGTPPSGASINSTSGTFSWTPSESQDGMHTITIQVEDGAGATDSEAVTVTVSEVNADPVLASVGSKSVDELEELAFTATASDGDVIGGTADTLEFSLGAGAPTGASINSATGAFSWTPSESQDDTHTITIQVEDGNGGSDSEAVTVTVSEVNADPVLASVGSRNVDELEELTFTATASDGDVIGGTADSLEFSLGAGAPTGASINQNTGAFSWTPSESQDGMHTITIRVEDGNGGSDSEAVTVTVSEVNADPVLASVGSKSVNKLEELTFTATASDGDVIGGTADSLEFSLGAGAPTGASINQNTGAFSWTPTASQVGEHTVTVVVTDGSSATDSEAVTVTVTESNENPVLGSIGAKSVDELATLSFTATATDGDNDSLEFSLAGTPPSGASINSTSGAFSWTPSESQDGAHTITIQVEDGNGGSDSEAVTVTVSEVNADPVLASVGSRNVDELESLTFTATASDGDVIGGTADSLEFSLGAGAPTGASINSATGAFSWTPSESQDGMHTITIQVEDGAGATDSEAVTVTVSEVNADPVLASVGSRSVDELEALTFTATASDGDVIGGTADSLEFSLGAGAPTGASINQNTGAFSWTPSESQDDTHTITIQVEDGNGGSDSEAVTVTVNEVNADPVLASVGSKSVNKLEELTFTATASDGDVIGGTADTLEFSLGAGAPTGASINQNTGAFSWTPTASQVGEHTVTVVVTDGSSATDSEAVTVTVTESSESPDPPPTFVSSGLDGVTGVLTITFSEEIDATPATSVVPAKIHIRESGSYTGGITLAAGELDTTADGATISFTLTAQHLTEVAGLAAPELTIEPGAVRDTSDNPIAGTFDASTATFVDAFSVSSEEANPTGMAFSNDGAKMFVVGYDGEDINEYALSTAFDASTATFVDAFSVSPQETIPQGMAFSSDGAKMFVVGIVGDDVNEYALSTPFDASTATFVDAFSVSPQETNPQGMAFSSDGAKMFVIGNAGDDVNEYALSAAFDASTAEFVDAFSVSSQETSPQGMAFSSDGAKMFVTGSDGDDVNEYALSTPFDASTAEFVDAFSVSPQETSPQGMAFSSDGAKMFVIGNAGDDVNEYALSSVYPITVTGLPPTFDSSELDSATGVLTITFSEEIDATPATNVVPTRIHIRESGSYTGGTTLAAGELDTTADGATISFTLTAQHLTEVAGLATPELTIEPGAVRDTSENPIAGTFDVSTAVFVDAFSVSPQETIPQGMAFSSDGAKMFVVGIVGDDVNEYALSTPFDASTATFVDAFSVSSQENNPTGMAFSSDGAKMFVIGYDGDDVNEYALSTPFDASTATFVDAFSVSSQETNPTGMAFSSDGAKMFVTGSDEVNVNEYALSAAFDASTATFVDAFSVSSEEPNPQGMAFSSDGAKMFVVGYNGEDINEYALSAAFDASTATFVDAFSVSPQEAEPAGMAFSSDGAKMFVVGYDGDDVNEYALSSVYPITVTDPPPAFVSSELDSATGVLTITFSEEIDATPATNVVPAKIHIRESGSYTGGITLAAGELDTTADGATISFTLTAQHLTEVAGLATPELTIEPGAVRDTSGNPIAGTFDASTAVFVDATSVSSEEIDPAGMAFSSDGAKMFVVGYDGDDVNEYALSTPFDASTATHVDATSVSSEETSPRGMAFSSDGAKMFVVGSGEGDVNEYALSTAFDASTATFVDAFSVSSQDVNPAGMAFSSDGAKMFVVGHNGDDVNEYALSAAFDASTAEFVDAFSVSSEETSPTGMAFSSDGAKMFVIGSIGDGVNEYALSTAFDASTAVFVDAFSVSPQETIPQGMAFSNDGAKMFVIGNAGDDVNEYALSSVYPITVTGPPPTFVSSELDSATGVLTITFSEEIDATPATNVVPARIHIRESGSYTGGTTLAAGELDTTADGATISFTLTAQHLTEVAGLATPELTIEPGAVRDTSDNPIAGTFDASTAVFVDDTSVSSEETSPRGIAFSSDGAKMFVIGNAGDEINEYTLSTAFDASTRSFVSPPFDVSSQETVSQGMAFSNDGTKMFVTGSQEDNVNEYTLSTAFDVSTAAFVSPPFDVSSQETAPTGIAFSNDGAKMFIVGDSGNDVNEYALSTAFDVSTATFVSPPFDVSSQETTPTGIAFSNDGAKMFVVGFAGGDINEYALSTAFDASTAEFVDAFSVSSEEASPQGMAFSSDGAKMFVVGFSGADVNEYTLSSVYPITVTDPPPAFVSSELDSATGVLTITFSEEIDATPATNVVPTKIHIRESGNYTGGITLAAGELGTTADGATISFTLTAQHLTEVAGLATPELTIEPGAVRDTSDNPIAGTFDASTAVFVDAFSVSSQETSPQGMAFSSDGAKMFVIGGGGGVNEYMLSTPFDASTATFVDAFSVSSQDSIPSGMAFSSDGAKMFVVGDDGEDINEYMLSTAFDASTATFVDAFSVSSQDFNPSGMAFSSDGAKMFVVGNTGDKINEYALSAAFDASTAEFVDAFLVSSQETSPTGMAFSSDGAKMFVIGNVGGNVNEYALSTPFDASTAVFAGAFSVSSQETIPQGMAFSSDGAKMFVVGLDGADVNEYALSSVYPIAVTGPPPTFVSSELDSATGVLAITFSEEIDATPPAKVVPTRIHIRESGSYTGGITLAAGELDTTADGATISFTLTAQHLTEVAGLAAPELTIEPGAVRDTSGNPIAGTFDASTAVFVDATSVASEETSPQGMAFSSDGAKMFVIGSSGDDVNEYALSTAFDASTATFVDAFSVSSQDTFPTGMAFSSDGTKMFVIGYDGDGVNEYALSTPFDASTAEFVDAFSVSSEEASPTGMAFSSDGAKMFVVGLNGDDVNEYALSTPFDVSTAEFVDAFSVSSEEASPAGMAFSSDGAKMFVIGFAGDDVNEYALSTPFDASTATHVGATSVSSEETSPRGMAFSNDGAKMFVVGSSGDDVNEYALSSVYPITVIDPPPAFVSSELDSVTGVLTITFSEEIDATPATSVVPTRIHIRESGNYTGGITLAAGELDTTADGATISFTLTAQHLTEVAGLATPELTIEPGAVRGTSDKPIAGTFDVSTAAFVDAFSVSSQETSPTGMAFSSDGAKMFVVGFDGDSVNEYALSTPFDASTATFVDAFSVSSQETSPRGMAFSSDGARMFVVGYGGEDINEYALSTPFDASTAEFVDAFSVSSQETIPQGMAFSSGGARMFVVGSDGDDVNEYALSTPFDASTAEFVDAFSVSSQEITPTGMAFSSDGAKMFVIGFDGDDVNEYALSTPFDASTAEFVDAFSVSSEETNPAGMAFSSDGAKMFVIGFDGGVSEYALSSVYPITVTGPPPAFVSSELDSVTGVLAITFSEEIDATPATNVVPTRIHIRESGSYTGGTTLAAGELDTTADGATISFTLTAQHLAEVAGLAAPELTIEPGAVRDTSGNPIAGTFDASTAVFVDATSVASEETSPQGMAFSSDGAKMFVVGNTGDDVNEYALSTPFDASTATFADAFSVSSEEANPQGMAFSSDGAKVFVVGRSEDNVNEYALSTPFDASTATFVDAFSVSSEETNPTGMAFSSDGAKMFVVGRSEDNVNEYALSTPFDASTAEFVDAFSVSSEETNPAGMAFSSDGAKMFVVGNTGDDVNEYALSTPFDASTAVFVDAFSVSSEETAPTGMAFSSDGAKMFVVGNAGDDVNEYALSSVYPITVTGPPPTFVSSELDSVTGVLAITFSEEIDATPAANVVPTRIHIRESGSYTGGTTLAAGELDTTADGATISFTLTAQHLAEVAGLAAPELTIEPGAVRDTSGNPIAGTFDVSTAVFVDAFSVSSQETSPSGMAFSSDGAKMFVVGFIGMDINEYALSTPFDASTATFVDAFLVSSQDASPTGMAFSSDGTKVFVVGRSGEDINEYALSTAFDASTATFVDAFSVSSEETNPARHGILKRRRQDVCSRL